MSIDLKVDGDFLFTKPGSTKPWRYQLSEYTSTEDITPVDGGDSSGGTGQVTFAVQEDPDINGTVLTYDREIQVVDTQQGTAVGRITSIGNSDGVSQITAMGKLSALVAEATVPPFTGTLGNAFRSYLGRVGITSGEIDVDSSINSRAVIFPGFQGDVWTYLKDMCVAQEVEIAQVGTQYVLRPLSTTTLDNNYNLDANFTVDTPALAKTVEIYNYNNVAITNQIVWPSPNGWIPEAEVFTVEARQTVEYDIEINASLTSVQQPVCVDSVKPEYIASSRYAVGGADGLMVPADQWTSQGGSLTVSINPDGKSLHVTIVGSGYKPLSPYKIAMVTETTEYSSLRIVGTGVRFGKELYSIPTGVAAGATDTEVGVTVDNIFVSDANTAWRVGARTAQRYAGPTMGVTVTSGRPLALDSSGVIVPPIGKIAGAIVKHRDSNFRVKSASIGPDTVNYTAERFTTFNDFNAALTAGGVTTFDQWNAIWAPASGKTRTFNDQAIEPLRNTA